MKWCRNRHFIEKCPGSEISGILKTTYQRLRSTMSYTNLLMQLNTAHHRVSLIQYVGPHVPVANFYSQCPGKTFSGRLEWGHQWYMPGSSRSHIYSYEAVTILTPNTLLSPPSNHIYCCDIVGPKELHQLSVMSVILHSTQITQSNITTPPCHKIKSKIASQNWHWEKNYYDFKSYVHKTLITNHSGNSGKF